MENAKELLKKTGQENKADKCINSRRQSIKLLNKILKKKTNLTPGEITKLQYRRSRSPPKISSIYRSVVEVSLWRGSCQIESAGSTWSRFSAFQGRLRTGTIVNLLHKDLKSFLYDAEITSIKRLTDVLKKDGNLKVNVELACKFSIL